MTTSSRPLLTASEFRKLALSVVGLPYVLGAEVKWPKRPTKLDCSELVEWLFDANGTPIGDLAAWQYDKTVKATGDPRVGDLVFLRNNPARANGIGHVAVITGKLSNGDYEIVEARGRAAGTVRTTLSYWKRRRYYTGIRRFPGFALTSAVANTDRVFRFYLGNMASSAFGHKPSDKTDTRGKYLRRKEVSASIMALQETPEVSRDAIRDALGGADRYITWPVGMVGTIWSKSKWDYTAYKLVSFGNNIHGAVRVTFRDPGNGQLLDVINVHNRSKDSIGGTAANVREVKEKYLRSVRQLVQKGRYTILAGDMSMNDHEHILGDLGLTCITETQPTYNGGPVDAIYTNLPVRKLTRLKGPFMDHWGFLAQLTLPKKSS